MRFDDRAVALLAGPQRLLCCRARTVFVLHVGVEARVLQGDSGLRGQ